MPETAAATMPSVPSELAGCVAKRGHLKASLTRAFKLTSVELATFSVDFLANRRNYLETTFESYSNLCQQILSMDPKDKEPFEEYEEHYLRTLTIIDQCIKNVNAGLHSGPQAIIQRVKTALPPISITSFSGKFSDYVPFINLFTSLIANDPGLDQVQKFYYLRSYLKDEPYNLVKNLPITGESFEEALKILEERYQNKYRIVSEHINILIDLKPIVRSTAIALREFISCIKQQLAAIKNHEPNVVYWDTILITLLSRKLDSITARAYQLEREPDQEVKLDEFIKFLERRALALENADQGYHAFNSGPSKVAAYATPGAALTCSFCKLNDHKLYTCKKFLLITVDDRLEFVKTKKLCNICLGTHPGRCKFHFRCAECKGHHNTLLHCNPPKPAAPVTLTSNNNIQNNVLLPTARVKTIGKDGTVYHVRTLLDSGSQLCFITSKVVGLLGYTPKKEHTNIIGITNATNHSKYCIPIEIHSLKTPFKTTINCHVVDQITCNLPQQKVDISNVSPPPDVSLADEEYYLPGEVHILISSDVLFQILLPVTEPVTTNQLHSTASNGLRFIPTLLGHIVGGSLPDYYLKAKHNNIVLKCEKQLNETLAKFWDTEKIPEIFEERTDEQELCSQIFSNTIKLENNQFQVALPLKLPLIEVGDVLGESFRFALKRFLNLEKKLHSNPLLFEQYQKFIQEYVSLNHGHYVDIASYNANIPVYFLAHHAVINNDSKTTKLRVVFDGSMLTDRKISLNDLQLNGPVVQRDLFDIVLTFRLGEYTFTADIKRMFRNVRVDPQYTTLQHILWRDNPKEPIQCIRLDTVTYGLKSSSFLATRCLDELATRFKEEFPLASSVLKDNVYVDDIIYSNNDLQTTIKTQDQLQKLLKLGSFYTHKWSSNNNEILESIPLSEQQFDSHDLSRDEGNMKALGLKINVKDDTFIISSPEPFKTTCITKRSILSYIGKFYDPMGYVSPIIVSAKVIMQKMWILNTSWNDQPPLNIREEWIDFTNDLASMKPIIVKRNIDVRDAQVIELIGFSDASGTTAYGCCIYLRCSNKNGVQCNLLCSKSRINPIQKNGNTIPRLELNAALLLAKLIAKVYNTIKTKIAISNVYLFSDSKIVLAWIMTESIKLQAYVGNRVRNIREYTANWSWLYVRTNDNPADLISRGTKVNELHGNNLWWHGPSFLQKIDYSFKCEKLLEDKSHILLPELVPSSAFSNNVAAFEVRAYIIERLYNYSSFSKVIRIFAYILRFLNNINKAKAKLNGFISSTELNRSLIILIKHEQNKYLQSTILSLGKGSNVKGPLASLHPFLDPEGLLRVGGRLHHAPISYEKKHPIILPKESYFTQLLIRCEHERLLHAGPKLLLANLNQKFWFINGLLEVKKITHKCVVCFRNKAIASKQLMGSLPASRVTATSRPFEKVGMDFAGPIEVKLSRIRKSVIGKGYICLYVCFATKAVHLELTTDLTTETFLASFRRFIARRGLPIEVHCDNASTFKCARSQLVELYNLQASQSHKEKVTSFSSQRGVNFHFIPSYSPTFGGLWEASVKSTKYHLKRIVGKTVLTYEQLNTVLIEIESILNSRPLVPMSTDPSDYCYLTPGHFIIGQALTMYPEKDLGDIPQGRLKFWNLCTKLKQDFWNVWCKHYLNVLQNRPKWKNPSINVKVGSLVILKDENTPCMSWPMARVSKLFPGVDNRVRAVEVQTANKRTHNRAINKICVLPIDEGDE